MLSLPEGAQVLLDNDPVGDTPITLEDVTASRHELKLRKDGYKEKSIPILTTKGYRLQATIYLGIDETAALSPTPTPSASPSGTPTPTGRQGTPTPTPRRTGTPTPSTAARAKGKVKVLETPNGFLRVRASNSTSAEEITRLSTGDTVDFITLESGWYQVRLSNGQVGWVSAEYVEEQ